MQLLAGGASSSVGMGSVCVRAWHGRMRRDMGVARV